MARDVSEQYASARGVFETADATLGYSLSELCFGGPEEALLPTEVQQPAILAASIALLRAFEESGADLGSAAYVAGHSLGEYSALVAAGAVELADALRLVRSRGRYMQEAVPEGQGAMAAVVGCDVATVESACERARAATGQRVHPANLNAPEQTVISGNAAAVASACAAVVELGARRAVPLAVSAPFHSALMAPAAERLGPELAALRLANPKPPIVTNVDAEPNDRADRVVELLRRQVTEPVRFSESVARLAALGVTRVLEVGPGRVLSGLVARIDRSLARDNISGVDDFDKARAFVAAGAAS
jgi:[acyl-carrier-protein] S-malonyltransferase